MISPLDVYIVVSLSSKVSLLSAEGLFVIVFLVVAKNCQNFLNLEKGDTQQALQNKTSQRNTTRPHTSFLPTKMMDPTCKPTISWTSNFKNLGEIIEMIGGHTIFFLYM